ncbi:hypothetical protein J6590_020921 [Homalodisca vitripennis]|nr:hypothetical protein J6590_020921 [Homalodisca vitripennis]
MTSPTRSPFSNPLKIRRRGSIILSAGGLSIYKTYTRLLVILDSPLPWPRTSTTPFYETPPRYITSRFYFGYTAVTALPQRSYIWSSGPDQLVLYERFSFMQKTVH